MSADNNRNLVRPSTSSDFWFSSSNIKNAPSVLYSRFRKRVSFMLNQANSKFYSDYSNKGYIRYIGLVLWCLAEIGLNFLFDVPGSLQNVLMLHYKMTPNMFSFIYSVYSWPNIFLCVFGGYLIDRVLGIKWSLIMFVIIATVGQIVFTLGAYLDLYLVMLTGRFIYGSGSESSLVAFNKCAALWFSTKEINLVFAIMMNMQKLGSCLVFIVSQPTFHVLHKNSTTYRALVLTLVILASAIVIVVLSSFLSVLLEPPKPKLFDINEFIQEQVPSSLELFKLPLIFWLLAIIISSYMSVTSCFLSQAQAALTRKYDMSDSGANNYIVFFCLFATLLSTCMGIFIDFKGRNMIFVFVAFIAGIIAFTLLIFTPTNPFIGLFFLSMSQAAFVCSIWSPVSFIVPENKLGTAYGIIGSGMNLSFSIGVIVSGAIAHHSSYEYMNIFFLSWILATIPFVIWCWIVDSKSSKLLNMSGQERKEYLRKRSQGDVD